MAELIKTTVRFPGAHAYCAALAAGKDPLDASRAAEALITRIKDLDRQLKHSSFFEAYLDNAGSQVLQERATALLPYIR